MEEQRYDLQPVTENWPTGIIPRIQPQQAHEKFIQDNPGLDTVMLQIDAADRILSRGEIASTYFDSSTSVITTSTIHDDKLAELKWRREEGIVRALRPDYHIPTDYWVYGNMDKEARIENIEELVEGTRWMTQQLADTKTTIIPLVKGFTPEERAICYQAFDDLNVDYCAFYGSQYFGGDMGNGINALNRDLRDITSEFPLDGILLIGLQSKNYLSRLPPEVVAAAGQRWIRKSNLRENSITKVKQEFVDWKQQPESELGAGNTTLGSFMAGDTGVTA
jgi:hypothetical protein